MSKAKQSQLILVVVETPRGSRNKYDWEPEIGRIKMSKVLPEGHVFPYDFGFIPDTLGEDGDPLDVLIFTDAPVGFPGCAIDVRLIGVIEAEQTERDSSSMRNDRLLGVADVSRTHEDITSAANLPPHVIQEIERFFISYNEQSDKEFRPLEVGGPEAAATLLKKGRAAAAQRNRK